MAGATRYGVGALLVVCAVCPQVQAHEAGSPFVLEANGGWQGPMGYGGMALVYDRGRILSAGLGSSDSFPPAGGSPVNQVYRSPSTALQLSLFSTLGSLAAGTALLYASQGHSGSLQTGAVVAFALGLTVAPVAGHLYAGDYGRALLTTTVRVAAGALATWVFINSIQRDCSPGQCHAQFGSEGPVLALLLALLVPATAVYDIADAPRAASRANERHGLKLDLVPKVSSWRAARLPVAPRMRKWKPSWRPLNGWPARFSRLASVSFDMVCYITTPIAHTMRP